ncbi:hypothetical protein P171DRAFT_281985 [Karstenula rhodostoma CBS 690.94]|uniref:DJ-1/PfpI domain-containing protein n=1 Tax=Karstenula rhodostoma CBS 690.94 TaxID=1392251 RepID=A0A9P4PKU0_9PLEO|nr:hypothetical protein P171DRAFT_281985 [Karstenula rhodostoma CBS 690.94]
MYLNKLLCKALGALTVFAINIPAQSTTNSTQKPLRVGVLYENVQLSNLSGLDVLGFQTPEIVAVKVQINPDFEPLLKYTTPMDFLYISSLNATTITHSMYVEPTHTYGNAPVDLDILLIGGPDSEAVKEESLEYMRQASKNTKMILTTCSDAMWLAKGGVLDGKKATTNRVTLGSAGTKWLKVDWLDQRWVIEDGLFGGAQSWTAGGAGRAKFFYVNLMVTKLTTAGIDIRRSLVQ